MVLDTSPQAFSMFEWHVVLKWLSSKLKNEPFSECLMFSYAPYKWDDWMMESSGGCRGWDVDCGGRGRVIDEHRQLAP